MVRSFLPDFKLRTLLGPSECKSARNPLMVCPVGQPVAIRSTLGLTNTSYPTPLCKTASASLAPIWS